MLGVVSANEEAATVSSRSGSQTAMTAALQALARQHQLTINTLVQGAWALLLSRYSGQEDVVFGATVSGRPAALAGVESMVGLFINTLPVRVQVSPEASLLPWLQALQASRLRRASMSTARSCRSRGGVTCHQGCPCSKALLVFENYPGRAPVQEWVRKPGDPSGAFCFQGRTIPHRIGHAGAGIGVADQVPVLTRFDTATMTADARSISGRC